MSDKKADAVKIDVELTEQQARYLALLIKRLSFSDVMCCAVNEDEAYRMIGALGRLEDALARHGYEPR